jgi:hypothetical protein
MATTTNYAWTTPDNSGLVKNGAQDIRTLGSSVDTALWNSGYGQAGKNKIINGDFRINQRSFTSATTEVYGFDRWITLVTNGGGSVTSSAQTFTAGTAPVAGYEAINFYRCVTASQTATDSRAGLAQRIEDVRTFAGQTVTMSFWAKAATGTPNISASIQQRFGSGGSAVVWTLSSVKTITTSWARYSFTLTVPSVAGKTIASDSNLQAVVCLSAGSDIASAFNSIGVQNNTFDIWGVQVEAGSIATPFQTASGGSPQAELAMCQRYYQVIASGSSKAICNAMAYGATSVYGIIHFNTQMRTTPTISQVTGTNFYSIEGNAVGDAFDSIAGLNYASEGRTGISVTSGIATTQGFSYWIFTNNASAFLALQAEL